MVAMSSVTAHKLNPVMSNMNKPTPQSFSEHLIAHNIVSRDQLAIAHTEQRTSWGALDVLLVDLGLLPAATLREALADYFKIPCIDLSTQHVCADVLTTIPRQYAERYHVFPLSIDHERGQLTLAMANPKDLLALDMLQQLAPERIRECVPCCALSRDITHAITRHYHTARTLEQALSALDDAQTSNRADHIIHLADALFADAYTRRASDIHLEPEAGFIRIRYRIDGVLHQVKLLHRSHWPALLTRIKVISGMSITETRMAQDGHISVPVCNTHIELRVASMPTLHGENMVLRILDPHSGILTLDALGLQPSHLPRLQHLLTRRDGIMLVTGPTGAGKTTTLYALLTRLNHSSRNIMTLEDPVEYPLPLVRQTSLNSALKLDFASGIRALLRQDPDILLVGEIRDADTAEMAIRAALIGHQVYSTLHSASALGAIARLFDLGIRPALLAGQLQGIIGQRLVRKLCATCKAPYTPDANTHQWLALNQEAPYTLFRAHAQGCPNCQHSGYHGRCALMEIVTPCDELNQLIAQQATLPELIRCARTQAWPTLADDARLHVLHGMTALSEVTHFIAPT